jgi:hypothetical protein
MRWQGLGCDSRGKLNTEHEQPNSPYNPLAYETWPEEQQNFAGEVIAGLSNGDLQPLSAYLRAGYALDKSMAKKSQT